MHEFGSRDSFFARLPQATAVVTGLEVELRATDLERAERLRVIATRTSQLRHIDVEEATRREIAILSIDPADPLLQETTSTAEEAFALLLALLRNIPAAFDSVKAGRWERSRYGGVELRGKTLGIVGFGRLGKMVAGYAQAFGMHVVAYDPQRPAGELRARSVEPATLEELLRRADAVTIHCPYSPETVGLLGAEQLGLMKPSAVLVNTARGEIVDEGALLRALAGRRIAGAAIDTLACERADGSHLHGNPLVAYARENDGLIIVPHLGGATAEATARTQRYISERLVEWLRVNGAA